MSYKHNKYSKLKFDIQLYNSHNYNKVIMHTFK